MSVPCLLSVLRSLSVLCPLSVPCPLSVLCSLSVVPVCAVFLSVLCPLHGNGIPSSDWSPEWSQPADWWRPKSDKDKWRAFEPVKETSKSEWWKEKLDDDLWNAKAHEATPGILETVPSTEPVATTKPVSENKGEKQVNNFTNDHETRMDTTSASGTTKPQELSFSHPFYKKGEMNSFVEPDPASYYSSSGEYYARNGWDSSYAHLYQSKEPFVPPQNNKQTVISPKNKESVVLQKSKASILPAESVEPISIQNSGLDEHKILPVMDEPRTEKSPVLNLVKGTSQVRGTYISAPQHDNVYQKEVKPETSNKVTTDTVNNNNTLIKSKSNNEDDARVDIPLGALKNKPLVAKEGGATAGGTNTVYGKGESLSNPLVAPAAAVVAETTKKPEEVTTSKSGNEFVDWVDWDNSVFDYYEDDDEEENSSTDKTKEDPKKDNKVSSVSQVIKSDVKTDDGNTGEDNIYEEYEDDDDEDDDDDDDHVKTGERYKITKRKNGKVTISGKKNKKEELNKGQVSDQPLKGLDFDTMDMQSDEAASHVDYSHYSKGVIYDSANPNHQPSTSKDLTHPASLQVENKTPAQNQDPSLTDNGELQNPLVKKSSSVTHVQPDQLNTESDVSTSPNPPPPGVASSMESTGTVMSSTTPVATNSQSHLDVDSLVKQQAVDSSGFILSFPLEFCRVDYECRAGRTCVLGVCKCYTPSMCAGHHKPICGSDGKQYDSHCELHRTACVNRVHIRADRRGQCFQKQIEDHEKSWLMEQEQLLQEEQARQTAQSEQSIHIPTQQIQEMKKETESSGANTVPQVKEKASPASTERTTTTDQVPEANRECTWKDMGKFKDDLLMFYCQKFVEPNCKDEVKTDREYLSMLMFSYYDKNFDYYLTAEELNDKERDEHFMKNILLKCHLHDFIKYADNLESDGKLTVSEFTSAF
ncbi:unnamed protein product, partial [Candidula unifasciata]